MHEKCSLITLKNGRQLGFAEFGDPKGRPVFFVHGFPGSRLQAADFHEVAKAHGYHLLGVDRPGMGLSSYTSEHSILAWVSDISAVADYLKIDKFSIIGHSGGAPFALACAYAIPERLDGVAIVSGIAPYLVPELRASMAKGLRVINFLVRTIPGFALLIMQLQRIVLNLPAAIRERVYKKMIRQLPSVEQAIFQNPEYWKTMIATTTEAFKQGTRGAAQELQLILNPWGFDLEKIKIPITIWQGSLDTQVPISHAKFYKTHLLNAKLQLIEQEGHCSILYNRMGDILT